MEFPRYMEKGSHGAAANVLLGFLSSWAAVQTGLVWGHGITCDGLYGAAGASLMMDIQRAHGLEPDGGCGPATRQMLNDEYGFDLETEARAAGGTTYFFQPDGPPVIWSVGV